MLSLVWAWIFGIQVLGPSAPTALGLAQGVLLGLSIVGVCHLLYRVSERMREATRFLGGFFGPIRVRDALLLATISGIAEEVFFRGALWPHLGLVGTSVLFAICHVVPVRELAAYPLFAFLAGIVFGFLRERTGSVWPCVAAHATVNALNLAWIGAVEHRRSAPAAPPRPPAPEPPPPPPAELLPLPDVPDTFPVTVWRYDLHLEISGTDRENLPQCLEHEQLAIFAYVARPEVYEEIGKGLFVFTESFEAPLAAFPNDLATLSAYLFQPVTGIELAERYVDEETTDDVRAWKIVANRGEWVKVPLLVGPPEEDRFVVDADREDTEVLAAHWKEYPRWFQDAMRFKYPRLRDL
ncbi:MAG TPA: CPBP family intramembrane glutamic endopeptidase [Planctomycetota bacterium]|nr:CPBP family intramembrane glutamic endopeptidase [Planctomycetota bacterium]